MFILSPKLFAFLAIASQSFSALSAATSKLHVHDLEDNHQITSRDDTPSITDGLRKSEQSCLGQQVPQVKNCD